MAGQKSLTDLELSQMGLERVFPPGHQHYERVFYDAREGKYYDRGRDMYMSYEEARSFGVKSMQVKKKEMFELVYGNGGHGGPYHSLDEARNRARALLRGSSTERTIYTKERGGFPISDAVERIEREEEKSMDPSIKSQALTLAKQGEELRQLWVMVKDLAQAMAGKAYQRGAGPPYKVVEKSGGDWYVVDKVGNQIEGPTDERDARLALEEIQGKEGKSLPSVPVPEAVGHPGQKGWDDSVEAIVRNIREYVKKDKRQGTVGMSRGNLKQVISTAGVNMQGPNPQELFSRAFDEAVSKVNVPGFDIY